GAGASPTPSRRRPAGHDRRRRHLQARRRTGGGHGGVSVPENVEHDYPLARLATVRAGGPADLFARPASEGELAELLRWAASEKARVGVVGSGSNLLISDQGFRGLVLKL